MTFMQSVDSTTSRSFEYFCDVFAAAAVVGGQLSDEKTFGTSQTNALRGFHAELNSAHHRKCARARE